MLNRDVPVDNFKHLHTQICICRNSLGVDLTDVKLGGVNQRKETSAEGDREFNLFPVDGYFLVLFVNESRYVGQGHALYLSFLYNSGGAN